MSDFFDETTANGNFTWTGSTATTTDGIFTLNAEGVTNIDFGFATTTSTWHKPIIPDKNWMPYVYFEYDPKWHKKFARYKIQISKMWD